MMKLEDQKRIEDWNDGIAHQFSTRLVLTRDRRSKSFKSFFERFSALSPNMSLYMDEVEEGLPYVQIRSSFRYQALPENEELTAFLEMLTYFNNGEKTKVKNSRNKDKSYPFLPAALTLFVTNNCPFCPSMVRRIFPLADFAPDITIDIVDGMLFTEKAAEYGIQSVPTLVLDNDFRWNGMVNVDEILEIIASRDPSKLGTPSLENLLQGGNAGRLSEMMLNHQKIFPAFVDLLTHEKWPTRLGAMVVIEEIIEKDIFLAERIVDLLEEDFSSLSDQIKGDMIYLFGQMASQKALPIVMATINESQDAEIQEIAQEALEKIHNKVSEI